MPNGNKYKKHGANGNGVSKDSSVWHQQTRGMDIGSNVPPRQGISKGTNIGTLGRGERYKAYQAWQSGRREKALAGKWPTPAPPKDLRK